ncbi:MAG: putative transposase [Bacteroidales bacterium]|jgi:hypothetical protein|nr:putative transposase [Bacteroidales bacterium]MDN5329695.1 putative transposase [Bacteroidales bacterium]
MRREVAIEFKPYATKSQLCRWLDIPRSSFYYKPSEDKPGTKPSTHTLTINGASIANEEVVSLLISEVFSQEFNLYGLQKN